MTAINSIGIKLGNSNCRLACASIKECGTLGVSCLAGADEQFSTKTLFTIKYNADYSDCFEQCLAGTNDELNPSNIVFDALNLSNSNWICYSDEDFGSIFGKKDLDNYKLELCDENGQKQKNVLFKDIEVVAGILAKLLESAKEQLPEEDGHEIRQIVITIPSLAEYEHREKLLKAVKILGLPSQIDVQLMAQITAAAIAYRHKEGDAAQGNILFFYMGARNTEYAIYKFLEGQTPELISADGFVDFGGENFTIRLVQEQMDLLKREEEKKWWKMENEEKRMVYRNVRVAMEKVKEQLGCKELASTKIDLGPTLRGRQFKVSKEQFESNCHKECRKLELFMSSIFKDFNGPINRVVLVGNSSKLYLVRQFFAKFDNKILPTNALAPELAAVQGAAIKAASEAFIANGNGNSPPKCFTRALLPNVAFHAIYGNIYSFDLPSFLMQFGQILSNEISINSFMNSTWFEQMRNGNNEIEIMKSGRLKINTLKYFVKIDKNGLLQFRCQNGTILCENDSILEKCIKRFKEYELDVKRVKKEQAKWEENRKREKFLKAQQKQKELEEKKKQQAAGKEILPKQKVANEKNENEKAKEKNEIKYKVDELLGQKKAKDNEEKENHKFEMAPVTRVVDKNEEDFGQMNLEDENKALDESFEVISSEKTEKDVESRKNNESLEPSKQWQSMTTMHQQKHNYELVNVFIEYRHNKNAATFLKGSWDNWSSVINMKYSQFAQSFLAIVTLSSKSEYEFIYLVENQRNSFYDAKYPIRYSQTWQNNCKVNVLNLNSSQIGKTEGELENNGKLLEKIITADNFMLDLVNQMQTNKNMEFSKQEINRIVSKYAEIRNGLPVVINLEAVKALMEEADRAHTHFGLIFFFFYDWKNVEKQSSALKKSETAKQIRASFKEKLLKLTLSKADIVKEFINYFCCPMLNECLQIGLDDRSAEIRQLKVFLSTDFTYNLFPN